MMPSKICTPDTTELSEDEKAENTAEEEEAEAEQTGDGDGDGGDGADAADAADGSDAADAAEAAEPEALAGLEDVAEVVVIVTVICTELHRQGRMPEHIFQADESASPRRSTPPSTAASRGRATCFGAALSCGQCARRVPSLTSSRRSPWRN